MRPFPALTPQLIALAILLGLPACNNALLDSESKEAEPDALELTTAGLAYVAYPYYGDQCSITPLPAPTGPVPLIASGYGARGANLVTVNKFANPASTSNAVCVYSPLIQTARAPMIVLMHGYGSPSAEPYYPLIDFLVSKGYVVVFPVYPASGITVTGGYAIMLAGIEAAVSRYANLIDTTKVGYAGHSLGGGAVPYLAHQGFLTQGWGASGRFLFIMAPWYWYSITNAQLAAFPANTKLQIQIYDVDRVTDHRMAKDLFDNFTSIATAEKDHVTVNSEASAFNYYFNADHYVPIKYVPTGDGAHDALDYYVVFRMMEALADYSFNGSTAGKNVALGNNSSDQRFMGTYPNGQAVRQLDVADAPTVSRAESSFSQAFSSSLNPRR